MSAPPDSDIKQALLGNIAQNMKHTFSPDSGYITVAENKLRLELMLHQAKWESRHRWETPAGVVIAIGLTLVTTDFKPAIGFSAAFWEALFILVLLVAIVLTIVAWIRMHRAPTVDDFIKAIRTQSEEVSSHDLVLTEADQSAPSLLPFPEEITDKDARSVRDPKIRRAPEPARAPIPAARAEPAGPAGPSAPAGGGIPVFRTERGPAGASAPAREMTVGEALTAPPDVLLSAMLRQKVWVLIYNPPRGIGKRITFLASGQVGDGQNENEHTWRINDGRLELLRYNGKVLSRFVFDEPTRRFRQIDAANTTVNSGQAILHLDDAMLAVHAGQLTLR